MVQNLDSRERRFLKLMNPPLKVKTFFPMCQFVLQLVDLLFLLVVQKKYNEWPRVHPMAQSPL